MDNLKRRPPDGAPDGSREASTPARQLPRASTAASDQELARLAKALGHPVRVGIVRQLKNGPCICGDLVEVLPLAQSTVSQHLKILRNAGLIVGEIDGPRRCYCLDPQVLARFRALLAEL